MDTHSGARRVFGGLVLIALFLLGLVIRPFFEAFIFAAVLAGALHPLQLRLARRVRGRTNLSASLLCVLVILALLVPFGGIAAFVVRESVAGVRFVAETVQSEGVTGLLDQLPE